MRRKGFTLIELVMVIVILGILAAVAIPTFIRLDDDARRSAIKGGLGAFRSAIAVTYARSAISGSPGYPSLAYMESSPGGAMQYGIPVNPFTGASDIVAGTAETTNAAAGWIYDQTTGKIWSSAAETQGSGY